MLCFSKKKPELDYQKVGVCGLCSVHATLWWRMLGTSLGKQGPKLDTFYHRSIPVICAVSNRQESADHISRYEKEMLEC